MKHSPILLTALVCGLFALTFSASFAAQFSYTCEVLNTYVLADDGSLVHSNFDKKFKGIHFNVSRIDGEIKGEVLPTLMADRTEILSRGDGKNSFRTIAYFNVSDRARPLVQTLDVQEFIKGKKKPFVSFSMGGPGIVTGVCE